MKELNTLSYQVINCAISVHKNLGPGLLESTYETCLEYELKQAKLNVERQLQLPITYGDIVIEGGYRIDLIVESSVIIELKSVKTILPIHEAQLMTYLKLSGVKLGLLINFNVPLLKQGITRKICTF